LEGDVMEILGKKPWRLWILHIQNVVD